VPSLTPQPEGAETLTAIAEGAEALSPMAEGAETLDALAVFIATAAVFIAGLLPASALYPGEHAAICATTTIASTSLLCGAGGPYPDGNETAPATGLSLDPETADALTLTPEAEA
jgi:hypothetical protein